MFQQKKRKKAEDSLSALFLFLFFFLSGGLDSNQRPLAPHASTLPGCATTRIIQVASEWGANLRKFRFHLNLLKKNIFPFQQRKNKRVLKLTIYKIMLPH